MDRNLVLIFAQISGLSTKQVRHSRSAFHGAERRALCSIRASLLGWSESMENEKRKLSLVSTAWLEVNCWSKRRSVAHTCWSKSLLSNGNDVRCVVLGTAWGRNDIGRAGASGQGACGFYGLCRYRLRGPSRRLRGIPARIHIPHTHSAIGAAETVALPCWRRRRATFQERSSWTGPATSSTPAPSQPASRRPTPPPSRPWYAALHRRAFAARGAGPARLPMCTLGGSLPRSPLKLAPSPTPPRVMSSLRRRQPYALLPRAHAQGARLGAARRATREGCGEAAAKGSRRPEAGRAGPAMV